MYAVHVVQCFVTLVNLQSSQFSEINEIEINYFIQF